MHPIQFQWNENWKLQWNELKENEAAKQETFICVFSFIPLNEDENEEEYRQNS